ncbi:hypothetical protein [Paraburkholderia sediminicola]|uniref:hypothetical protein n=1 Tax=Paraburkholderia sediminicola TaxID=458836 RepID=UPI0038BD1750
MGVVSVVAPWTDALMALNAYGTNECKARANDRRLSDTRMSLIYLVLMRIENAGSAGKVSNFRIRRRRRLKLHPPEKASGHTLTAVRRAGWNMVLLPMQVG